MNPKIEGTLRNSNHLSENPPHLLHCFEGAKRVSAPVQTKIENLLQASFRRRCPDKGTSQSRQCQKSPTMAGKMVGHPQNLCNIQKSTDAPHRFQRRCMKSTTFARSERDAEHPLTTLQWPIETSKLGSTSASTACCPSASPALKHRANAQPFGRCLAFAKAIVNKNRVWLSDIVSLCSRPPQMNHLIKDTGQMKFLKCFSRY
jgi:hypothetical protein